MSATSDVNRLSIEPSAANTAAETRMVFNWEKLICGMINEGNPLGTSPSLGAPARSRPSRVQTTSASNGDGTRRARRLGVPMTMAMASAPITIALKFGLWT